MPGTLWPCDEQTEGKHVVLRSYLDGWFPILGRWNGRLLFVDGFAGPGEYTGGEPGSPLVALDCIRHHKQSGRLSNIEVVCLFIESDPARAGHLEGLLAAQPAIPDTQVSVIPLELWKGNRHVYTLYFATGSPKGCDLMKKSIWKVDPAGGLSFRGYSAGQMTLFGKDTEPLAAELRKRFADRWVPVEDIDTFVMSDETPYHSGLLRRDTLRRLETEGRLAVRRPKGVSGFRAKRGVRVRFK